MEELLSSPSVLGASRRFFVFRRLAWKKVLNGIADGQIGVWPIGRRLQQVGCFDCKLPVTWAQRALWAPTISPGPARALPVP